MICACKQVDYVFFSDDWTTMEMKGEDFNPSKLSMLNERVPI
jgi:hypothetical protein